MIDLTPVRPVPLPAAGPVRRLRALAAALLPRACLLCETPCGAAPLCPPCARFLPGAGRLRCRRCARPGPADLCAACRHAPPPAGLTIAAADYGPPLDRAITALKFGGRTALATGLGDLLAQAWASAERDGRLGPIDLLVPVPLSPARLAERGFNQAHLIAAAARTARARLDEGRRAAPSRAFPTSLPTPLPAPLPTLAAALLQRRRETEAQSRLAGADRRANLLHGFRVAGPVRGRIIGVVDDVMTTGATLQAVGTALAEAGAAGIVNLVVARTP